MLAGHACMVGMHLEKTTLPSGLWEVATALCVERSGNQPVLNLRLQAGVFLEVSVVAGSNVALRWGIADSKLLRVHRRAQNVVSVFLVLFHMLEGSPAAAAKGSFSAKLH